MATEAPLLDVDVELGLGALRIRARLASAARRVAIVGPSGAGKSTLLRVLAGLERGARGRVAIRGAVWLDSAKGLWVPPWERHAAWVPQDARLFPHRSVRANLAFAGASEADVRSLAERLGVDALLDRMPRHLSGGEAQRVALGRALLARPRLLLLDEPFAALDRERRRTVSEVLKDVAERDDLPLVLVSHDERDVAALAEEVFEMEDGGLAPLPASPAGRAD